MEDYGFFSSSSLYNESSFFILRKVCTNIRELAIIEEYYLFIYCRKGDSNLSITVAKFGGTSLANGSQFKKVYEIIKNDPSKKYIVPSAPGKESKEDTKITDLLYLLYDLSSHGISYNDVFSMFKDRYSRICQEINLDLDLDPYFDEIEASIKNKASRDYISSRGEYLNGILLSKYLDIPFVDAKDVMIFKKPHVLDEEKTYKALGKIRETYDQAVIPGFYGALKNGEITTFSRGGGDLSGAIVARGVGADLYENWTDVSGFLAADPKLIKNPNHIEEISYAELRELSYMGASILHDEAIFPVISQGIPIAIKNTNAPEDLGTRIVPQSKNVKGTSEITGIAGRQGFSVINIEKIRMNRDLSFHRKVFSILEANDIYVEHIPSSIDSLSLIVKDDDLQGKKSRVISEIKTLCNPDRVHFVSNISLIAVVGQNMKNHIGTSAKLFTALAQAKINIQMITQGSSELNIIVGIDTDDFDPAIQAIYKAFF